MMTDDTTATPEASMGDGGEGAKFGLQVLTEIRKRGTQMCASWCATGLGAVRESCSGSDDDSSLCQDTLQVMTTRRM
jgi:hypothetical protein